MFSLPMTSTLPGSRGWGLRRAGHLEPPAPPAYSRPLRVPRAAENTKTISSMDIEDLPDYCNDFVCNSSPAVEATIRAFARDVERCNGRWTRSLLARDVEYKDAFRSCRGWDAYLRLDFAATKMQGAKAKVLRLRMLDNGSAVVSWQLTGALGPLQVDVGMETQLTLNLLTGQIQKQRDTWDLSRCSPPAALAWTAARALWAAQQASRDASEGTQRVLESLSSMDEEDPSASVQRNPNDPTRFFQQNDNTMQDAFLFSAFVALLWFMAQAYGKIFSL